MSFQIARINMIKQQLRTGDVLKDSILSLYKTIPREQFVPSKYKEFAYSDMQIPLLHDQRMLTPLEEALILQALDLKGHEVVLEVGTGTGFLTAMLSRLCKKVISVDYFESFTKAAQQNLNAMQCDNVELITADGHNGLIEKAPFDVIVFTGGLESLNDTHRLQILPGGKLFAITGANAAMQARLYSVTHKSNWSDRLIFETNTPLLINKHQHQHFVF